MNDESEITNKFDALCDSYELAIFLLEDAVMKVREIHVPKPRYVGHDIPCIVCDEILPCATLRALEGV
jgi:hypothetical protein